MGYAATVKSFRKAIAEQGQILYCSYAANSGTGGGYIYDNMVDLTGFEYLFLSMNWGVNANFAQIQLTMDGNIVSTLQTSVADTWHGAKVNLFSSSSNVYGNLKVALTVTAMPAIAWLKDLSLYKIDG